MATKNIVVAVRMRPLIPREIEKNEICWKAEPPTTICQTNTSVPVPVSYNFDHVYDGKVDNEYIYEEICSDIVKSVIDGFNGTIFAYGQTSSGKTFTMLGNKDKKIKGIMHYAVEDVFRLIQNMPDREFLLRVSYMELYNETVRDLLSGKDNLKLQEENGQIKVIDLQEKLVQKPEQILEFMKAGERNRRTGETRMNEKSSRSHAIFRMIIESCVRGVEDAVVNVSQFNLVDLAGSEKASDGVCFKETVKINQSLLSLGQVIRLLSENENQFISYRDSKLTRILQNSLGGNSLTAIICNVTAACFEETRSTLEFAKRAKNIRNKPHVNEVLTEQALLKQYANRIKKLTAELEATKEEKSVQNEKLQEKIKKLEKLFVFQMNPVKTKTNRRETWGGTLDAARFRSQIASMNSLGKRKSFSRSHAGHSKLSMLEEQCEDTDGDETVFPLQSTQEIKHSKRSSNSKRNSNLSLTIDRAVQVEPSTPRFTPKNPQSERDKMEMAQRISDLEKELAELREFTTLEKQIMSCGSSLDIFKESSAAEEGLPPHSESFSSNFDVSIFKEMEQKNIITEDSIFLHTGTSRMNFKEKEEDLFQYLESTMKIMGTRKHISFPSVANDLNNNHKIILEMFYLILQYQCLTLKTSFKSEMCKKIDEIFCDLKEIFKSFGDQAASDETTENLIEDFMDKTDFLLKEIEMFSLDSLAGDKNDIINQSMPFDSIIDLPSFEDSPHQNCKSSTNISFSMNKNGNVEENAPSSVCNCEKFKSTIAALEKEIETYQHSISAANSNKDELNDKVASLEKEIETYQHSISAANSNEDELNNKVAALEKQIEIYQTSTSDIDFENTKMKEKIMSLEKDLEVHLKTILDYRYDADLKDKQISILKDKTEIQKQMIDSFENELSLKDKPKCKCNLEAVSCVVSNNKINSLITFKDQACQISYMEGMSLYSDLNESQISEQHGSNSVTNLSFNHDKSLNESKVSVNEQISEEVCQQTLETLPSTNPEMEKLASDHLKMSFEGTLKDLIELKLFTLEFMKRDMKKEYLVDMDSFEEQVNYPLIDQIKVEVTALKEMLLRLEFFLHTQSDVEKKLRDLLESKLVELSALEEKLSESELAIKSKDSEFNKLECALLSIENNVSELVEKLKSLESVKDRINYFELEDDTSFILHVNKPFNYVNSIQRKVSEVDSLINNVVLSVNDLSVNLKETQDNLIKILNRPRETKSVQTITDYDFSDLSQKLIETEALNKNLDSEIRNLKSKLEILARENNNLQQEVDRKANFYETKIEDMKIEFGAEKEELVSKFTMETEEKYYRMMMDQESKFLEEKHQTELDCLKKIGDYQKKFADEFDELAEKNRKTINDLKNKLDAESEERYKEKIKLEDKIRKRENDLTQCQNIISYFKKKCKDLAVELQKRKEKVKSFEHGENVLHEKSVDFKQTQTDNNHLEDNPNLCDQCKVFVQKISDLEAMHQSALKKSEVLFKKLQNDLEAKKAKIISLDTNNAKMVQEIVDLKKELSTKSMFLRYCQCRGQAFKPVEAQNSEKLESIEKDKAINLNPENGKEKPSDLRHDLNSQDILQLEIVQNAIKKAKEEATELLLGGGGSSGPANAMQCYYLQAKLNKTTRELSKKIAELNLHKKELAELKKQPLKRGFVEVNEPLKNVKDLEGEIFTPYANPVNPLREGEALHPKMQRRKVLKETNRKSIAPFPTSKEEMRKERIDGENINPFTIPISMEDLKAKKSTVPDMRQENKEKALKTQKEIEMLFGAPVFSWD